MQRPTTTVRLFMVVPFAEVALAGLARLIFKSFMRLMLSDKLDAAAVRRACGAVALRTFIAVTCVAARKLSTSLRFVIRQPEPRAWAISCAL